jgi:hypothetical protein
MTHRYGLVILGSLIAGIAVLTAAAPALSQTRATIAAADAIAMADATSTNGRSGRFEIFVASAAKGRNATFLNSSADYRALDNLAFSLSPAVANMLAKRLGARPEQFLVGRRVVVDGIVIREAVAKLVAGRPHDLDRWQHMVRVEQVSQLVRVIPPAP